MNTTTLDSATCKKGFTIFEKVFAQLTFLGSVFVGAAAMAIENFLFGILYIFFAIIGINFFVMRYYTCPRCEQLWKHSDCLQFPVFLTKRIVSGYKDEPLTLVEKIIFLTIFVLLIIIPQYWLIQVPILFVLFWVCCLLWYMGQFFYFCKTCNIDSCPFYSISQKI